jgi:hypothetical protein
MIPTFQSKFAAFEMELLEAALQNLPFSALPAGDGIGRRERPQVFPDQSCQRGISIDGNFPNLFDQIVVTFTST